MSENGRFIGAIAVLVYHAESETYLVLRRSDQVDVDRGEWEVVTGRVHQGESFEDAAHREVREELGVEVELDFMIGTSHFFRGSARPEHEVLGVRYAGTLGAGDAIRLSHEHDAYEWMTASEIAVHFEAQHRVRRIVERAVLLRRALPAELISLHHRDGFLSD